MKWDVEIILNKYQLWTVNILKSFGSFLIFLKFQKLLQLVSWMLENFRPHTVTLTTFENRNIRNVRFILNGHWNWFELKRNSNYIENSTNLSFTFANIYLNFNTYNNNNIYNNCQKSHGWQTLHLIPVWQILRLSLIYEWMWASY